MSPTEIAEAWERLDREEQAARVAALDAVREKYTVERAALKARLRALDDAAEQPKGNAVGNSRPEDFLKQGKAAKDFAVSRGFLYDLAVAQLKLGATWIMRMPNGHFRYSRAGLEEYFKNNPVRRRRAP